MDQSQQRMKRRVADLERRLAAVSLANRSVATVSAPPSRTTQKSKRKKRKRRTGPDSIGPTNGRRVTGTDLLFSISVANNSPAGTVITNSPLSPRLLKGTRLYQESLLYTQWRPVKLSLRLTSSASQMMLGKYGVAWSGDPTLVLPSGGVDPLIRLLGSMMPSRTGHVSVPLSIDIPCDASRKWYILDGPPDDQFHGSFWALVLAELGATTGTGNVSVQAELSYTVDFCSPKTVVDETASLSPLYAQPGYAFWFTTSTNDWASGRKVVIKATPGAAPVPFPGAQPHVVYQLLSTAGIPYKKADGTQISLHYGVRIADFSDVVTLTPFKTLEGAKKYAKSGAQEDALDYHAASDNMKDESPAWIPLPGVKSGPTPLHSTLGSHPEHRGGGQLK